SHRPRHHPVLGYGGSRQVPTQTIGKSFTRRASLPSGGITWAISTSTPPWTPLKTLCVRTAEKGRSRHRTPLPVGNSLVRCVRETWCSLRKGAVSLWDTAL